MKDQELVIALQEVLGNTFVYYLHAHGAHWNVEGSDFVQLHSFFGDLAGDLYSSVDTFAEALRQHKAPAPYLLSQLSEYATIGDVKLSNGPRSILPFLLECNGILSNQIKDTMKKAEEAEDYGLSNFCQDRLASLLKYDWQIRSLLKT
jgi:starvation-inducible DNA-binding protein